MYNLLLEEYTTDYVPLGSPDRTIFLKSGLAISANEIIDSLHDLDAYKALVTYGRYKRYGLPFGPFGQNPNKLIEAFDLLDQVYIEYEKKRNTLER